MATITLTYLDRLEVLDVAPGPLAMADGRRTGESHDRVVIGVTKVNGGGKGSWTGATAVPGDAGEPYEVLSASGHDLSRHYAPGTLPGADLVAVCGALSIEEGLLCLAVNGSQVWPEPVLDTTEPRGGDEDYGDEI